MNDQIFEVTAKDFQTEVIESDLPVLIEFTADWCPPCKMLVPIINEIAIKYEGQMRVGLLDADANPNIIQQYSVMGLPTMMLFINGTPVERIVGFKPRERIESEILPHLTRENA